MIVKFIAVICLLLFIPKLEIIKKKVSNKGEDDEEERNLSSRKLQLMRVLVIWNISQVYFNFGQTTKININ